MIGLTVGFRINSLRCLRKLFPFAVESYEAGHKVVFLHVLDQVELSCVEHLGEIRRTAWDSESNNHDIDVLFALDGCDDPPDNCVVVGVHHSHHPIEGDNGEVEAYYHYIKMFSRCHYSILGQPNLYRFNSDDFVEMLSHFPVHNQGYTSNVVIPGGYSSVDDLLHLSNDDVTQGTILFAHVESIRSSNEARVIVDILNCIKQKFPNKEIVYSPYPSLEKIYDGMEIVLLTGEGRVKLNTDYDTSLPFARAEVLITDSSSAAETYSCGTLRPHIQCQFFGMRKKAQRTDLGWIVYSVEQLEEAIDNLNVEYDSFESSIAAKRSRQYLNFGSTANYIVRQLGAISKRDVLEGWIDIRRSSDESVSDNQYGFFERLSELPAGYRKMSAYQIGVSCCVDAEDKLLFSEMENFIKHARPIARHNCDQLVCCLIDEQCMRLVGYAEYEQMFQTNHSLPFFLSCSTDDTIDDFSFSESFVSSNFAGYIEKGEEGSYDWLDFESIFFKYGTFLLVIANQTEVERFSVAVDLFCQIKKLRNFAYFSFIWPSSSKLHMARVLRGAVSMLPSWEVLNVIEDRTPKPYYIWGCSGFYEQLKGDSLLPTPEGCMGFIDNDQSKWGTEIDSLLVNSLDEIVRDKPFEFMIVFAVSHIYIPEIILQIEALLNKKSLS